MTKRRVVNKTFGCPNPCLLSSHTAAPFLSSSHFQLSLRRTETDERGDYCKLVPRANQICRTQPVNPHLRTSAVIRGSGWINYRCGSGGSLRGRRMWGSGGAGLCNSPAITGTKSPANPGGQRCELFTRAGGLLFGPQMLLLFWPE